MTRAAGTAGGEAKVSGLMTNSLRTPAQAVADQLLQRDPIPSHPYFAQLADGAMTRATFVATQRQFYHAVRFFPRAMAALTARLPDSAGRQVLMHNLAEEHGYLESGFRPEAAHDCTFRDFLASLGSEPAPEGPAVRAFNLALYGACALEAPELALAALAMIEYAFADISARLGAAVVARGWVASEALVHYSVHAELDIQHSAELFEAVEGAPEAVIKAGLAFGWHIFAQLYRALLTESCP